MDTLRAVALNCSLKAGDAESSTDVLLREVLDALRAHGVSAGAPLRLVDRDIKVGVTSDEGDGDEWPGVRSQILDAQILVLGTPIWMGQPSSVAKRVLERLDAFLGEAGVHYAILEAIAGGAQTWSELTSRVGRSGGSLSRPLAWLEGMGLVERAVPVTEKRPDRSKRVLYRVTYVSRIPPKFQPVPDQTRPPDLEPPANVEYNALLIELIDRAIDDPDPSPLDIGTGISAVIGSADAPGPLAGLLPWWPQFLADTADYQLPAARILRTLREDLLRYMIEIYAMRADAHD